MNGVKTLIPYYSMTISFHRNLTIRKCVLWSIIVPCFASCQVLDLPEERVIQTSRKPIVFSAISEDSLIVLCNNSSYRNKSIGVFGGSYSIIDGSEIVKNSWTYYLNASVTNYGHNRYGFSRKQGSIQDDVDNCDVKDVYVLWASTNDFNNNRKAGAPTDYTLVDSFNDKNRDTQCGGINYCITHLREKNPDCLIVMISSSVFFQSEKGYDFTKTNETGETLLDYVEKQRECCRLNNVPFLDLLENVSFSKDDFREDGIHLNEKGYQKLILPTTVLIAQPQWFF